MDLPPEPLTRIRFPAFQSFIIRYIFTRNIGFNILCLDFIRVPIFSISINIYIIFSYINIDNEKNNKRSNMCSSMCRKRP